jgi:hypothetical protein
MNWSMSIYISVKTLVFIGFVGLQTAANACPYQPNDPRSVQSIGAQYAKNWPKVGEACSIPNLYDPKLQDYLGMANAQARKCYIFPLQDYDFGSTVRGADAKFISDYLNAMKDNFKEGRFGNQIGNRGSMLTVMDTPTTSVQGFPSKCFAVRDLMIRSIDEALADLAKQK